MSNLDTTSAQSYEHTLEEDHSLSQMSSWTFLQSADADFPNVMSDLQMLQEVMNWRGHFKFNLL